MINSMTKKGFTLVESMVVVSIIGLLSVVVLANYRAGDKQFALQRSTHKLAQDIRRAQNMAMSAKEFQGVIPAGYGIYLNKNQPNQYILFADLNGNKIYNSNEGVEVLELEKGVSINNLSPGSPLTIFFSPPDPTVMISPDTNLASIVLNFEGGAGKKININKAGLIEIE